MSPLTYLKKRSPYDCPIENRCKEQVKVEWHPHYARLTACLLLRPEDMRKIVEADCEYVGLAMRAQTEASHPGL